MRFNTVTEWLQWQEGLHPTEIDLGLDRLQDTFDTLSIDFSNSIVFTVAGTNGKGSCATLVSEILRHAGYRVGTYTSPHLLQYVERIKVNDVCISEVDLCSAFGFVDAARNNTTLTYFEFATLAALVYFSRQKCDVLVLEVGLGGRLDAVNIVDPDLAIITSIGLDHTEWLGANRDAIAYEKSGILRAEGQLVCGETSVPQSLLDRVESLSVTACYINDYYTFRRSGEHWLLNIGQLQTLQLPLPILQGEFQLRNAATAITAVYRLQDRLNVCDANIIDALKSMKLAGRLQLIAREPDQLVDVGHNQQAAEAIAFELRSRQLQGHDCHAVFAILKHKDVSAVIAALADVITHWHLAPLSHWESVSVQEIEGIINKNNALIGGSARVSLYSDIPMAWQTARKMARPASDTLLGFGSFYTVSEILIFN